MSVPLTGILAGIIVESRHGFHPGRQTLIRLVTALLLLVFGAGLLGCDRIESRRRINPDRVLDDNSLASQPYPRKAREPYLFGFDLRNTPEEDARQYLPFLRYLERVTGLPFELRFTPKSSSIAEELGSGRVQFAAIGPVSYLAAQRKYPIVPLVRGKNSQGRAEYQAAIIVAPKSPIRTVADLRGRRIAFGDPLSTQGHLIPRIILREHGLNLPDLASYTYAGSHAECADRVLSGRADACGLQDTLARQLAKQGLCRIILLSKPYPASGIAAHGAVQPEVIDRVRQALIAFDPKGADRVGLYHWEGTEMTDGFVPARLEDYAELGKWADAFGFFTARYPGPRTP